MRPNFFKLASAINAHFKTSFLIAITNFPLLDCLPSFCLSFFSSLLSVRLSLRLSDQKQVRIRPDPVSRLQPPTLLSFSSLFMLFLFFFLNFSLHFFFLFSSLSHLLLPNLFHPFISFSFFSFCLSSFCFCALWRLLNMFLENI